MIKGKQLLIAINVLVIGILSCSALGVQSNNQPDLVATITAQALLLQGSTSTPASVGTVAPALTATPAFTGTPSVPEVSVSAPTNCRTGPSNAYDMVFTMNPGETAQVVGKNTATNYWIIDNPSGGTCWLWGQYATVSGNTSGLPEMIPPPTPTPKSSPTPTLPAAPKNVSIAKACIPLPPALVLFQYSGVLTWKDVADNEKGYKVYMNGSLLASLPPNTTSFPLPGIPFTAGTPFTMGVEAFNNTGASTMKTDVISCP